MPPPTHVAIIMDGNGTWATRKGLPRTAGHQEGVKTLHKLLPVVQRAGVKFLTVYAFSVQNFARPATEVSFLFELFRAWAQDNAEKLCANNVRVRVRGDVRRLPGAVQTALSALVSATARNTGCMLVLALAYGGQEEVAAACAKAARAALKGEVSPAALEDTGTFRTFLQHPDIPDPDLLIRTSGKLRLSNFLLYSLAYTELVVTDKLWPDFGEADFLEAVKHFSARTRRFGKTDAQIGVFTGSPRQGGNPSIGAVVGLVTGVVRAVLLGLCCRRRGWTR